MKVCSLHAQKLSKLNFFPLLHLKLLQLFQFFHQLIYFIFIKDKIFTYEYNFEEKKKDTTHM